MMLPATMNLRISQIVHSESGFPLPRMIVFSCMAGFDYSMGHGVSPESLSQAADPTDAMNDEFRSSIYLERLRPSGGAQEARIQQGGLSPSDAPACSAS